MKKINTFYQLTLAIIILSSTSCKNFYKATSTNYKNNAEKTEAVNTLKTANRIFILRSGTVALEMKDIVVNNEKTMLECTLDSLSYIHKLHLTKGKKGNMQYKKNWPEHYSVLDEAHVYVASGTEAQMGKYSIALDKIQRVEVIEKDKGRTRESYILGGIGITAGVLLITSAIMIGTMDWNWGGNGGGN